MNQEDTRKSELRSEDIEDILGKMPGWLTRYGMMVLLAVILVLFIGTIIFQVPDVKQARITVSSPQPPAVVEARASGHVTDLFFDDNEEVIKGDVLSVIENSADYEDVIALIGEVQKLNIPIGELPLIELPVNGHADLGSIQTSYSRFYKSYRDYEEFLVLDYHARKIRLLQTEKKGLWAYGEQLKERTAILREDYSLAEKQFARDSLLYVTQVLAETEYEGSKTNMLGKRNDWKEADGLCVENEIKVSRLETEVLELELKQQERKAILTIELEETLNSLKSSIASWEQEYLLIAPIDGVLSYNNIWSENQNVRIGDPVLTVVPENSGTIIGKIQLPMGGAGEVLPGQQVNVSFENYPYLEYGMVKGEVRNISKIPMNDQYTVEVVFPDGLLTYYGREVEFHQNMQGDAEIYTEKERLISRIFNPIRSAAKRQSSM